MGRGVRIFRVDTPQTTPSAFLEWVIDELKAAHADVLFLAEAFTRPHVMYRLAKIGFSQSYTYFASRTTKQELTDYFTALTSSKQREFFPPTLWPNTPHLLPHFLQLHARPPSRLRRIP